MDEPTLALLDELIAERIADEGPQIRVRAERRYEQIVATAARHDEGPAPRR